MDSDFEVIVVNDFLKQKAANSWNDMNIKFLINHMERVADALETFEPLGGEAKNMIDNYITELESLRSDYDME